MRPPNHPLIHIKGMHFKNPFLILPGVTELSNPNGRVTTDLLMYYKGLARSEAALVIVGPATITPPVSRKFSLLRVDQPKYLDGLRALSKIVSSNGAIPGIQVTHPGNYEANELRVEPRFVDQLASLDVEKVVTAFRNACVRSMEVGFRYVELDARGSLVLHQLVAADREDVVRRIIVNGVKAIGGQGVLALRLDASLLKKDHYASLFIELGGDLVALSYRGQQSDSFFDAHKNACIESLYTLNSPGEVYKRLQRSRLLSLAVDFPEKRKQITSLF